MVTCHVCKQRSIATPWEQAVRMCSECANTFGVMPMLPARRPARPCERCNGMQFIRAVPRELAPQIGANDGSQVASPMTVTYAYAYMEGFFVRSAAPINTRKAHGYLEQYICKKCGFIEWYCNDPERIPIGPGFMTEDIDYGASDTPYRG
jgi:hypothetical protein